MQSSHSDWCSFVVLHFVNDIYFSVSFICASVFWEDSNTNWQVTE